MASLTPGTLQKLLQNVGNKDFKVAGEHRSALLQVINIVPSLEDDPWKSRGYFLRVSDSVHSAYVSVSDGDVELILSDKIQLGQFIHADRLDSGSPVPVLQGIKPVPKRRPCVGEPKDLISSDFLNVKKVEGKVKLKGKVKKMVGSEEKNVRRLSFGNGKVGAIEIRRLSLDSTRKGWDRSPQIKNGAKGLKPKSKDNPSSKDSVVTRKVFPEQSPKGHSISSSPLKNKNVLVSPKLLTKPIRKSLRSSDDNFPSDFSKVTLTPKKWSDSNSLWNSLPSTICDLGKDVRSHRNAAFVSAVHALEEASMFEAVIRCLSVYAKLCESSEKDSSGLIVEEFLNLHESMKRTSVSISSMIDAKNPETNDGNSCSSHSSEMGSSPSPSKKNTSLWVRAAIETDLSKFSLYRKDGNKGTPNGENCYSILLESSSEKVDTENHSPKTKPNHVNRGSSKSSSSVRKVKESRSRKGSSPITKVTNAGQSSVGLRHADRLLENLLSSARGWFLNYLEDSLKNGFGLSKEDDGCQISGLMGQLKRVNQWLDDAFPSGLSPDVRIERLRKKLYRFLLDHVSRN